MKNKKVLILSILSILLLIGVTVEISLAFFNYAQAGTTDNTIETGNITFLYTETSSVGRGIAIEDAFPISNEEGKLLTGEGNAFDFNISSTTQSNTNIPFEVTARKSSDSTLSEDVVVMYLTKVNGTNEEEVVLDKYSELSQTTKTNAYTEKVLYTGTVYSNDNYDQDYRLRMWITNDGTFAQEDMGKTFTVTVNVYANATVVTEAQIALENNTNINKLSVNNNEIEKVEDKSYDYLATLSEGTTSATLNIETEVPDAKIKVEKINSLAKSNSLTKLSTQITLIDLTDGTNLYKVTVTSANEKLIDEYILKIKVGNVCDYDEGDTWDFNYTGGEQTFTVPDKCSGTYRLETWGAQGGSANTTYVGGYGGYSVGNISLTENRIIYINVGGAGTSDGPSSTLGGYNGGGSSVPYLKDNDNIIASGGGATHIAFISGLLSTLENNKDEIIEVAGAGGGAYYHRLGSIYCSYGGGGGGYIGVVDYNRNANYISAGAGTQTSGGAAGSSGASGSFGLGGTSTTYSSGGGGGFYGGGSSHHVGTGGGSGYIGNPLLTNKAMYCYSCTESNEVNTKTINNTCHSSNPTENCAKEGNGYARITLVSLD